MERLRIKNSFPFFFFFSQEISWVEEKKLPSQAFPSKSEWLRITGISENTVFGIGVVKTTA